MADGRNEFVIPTESLELVRDSIAQAAEGVGDWRVALEDALEIIEEALEQRSA